MWESNTPNEMGVRPGSWLYKFLLTQWIWAYWCICSGENKPKLTWLLQMARINHFYEVLQNMTLDTWHSHKIEMRLVSKKWIARLYLALILERGGGGVLWKWLHLVLSLPNSHKKKYLQWNPALPPPWWNGHLIIMATFFGGHVKPLYISCKKCLVNTVTPLIRSNLFGSLVTVLTGFHCTRKINLTPKSWFPNPLK